MITHQLQVERRTGKVRQSETDVLPLCHATNLYLLQSTCNKILLFITGDTDGKSSTCTESVSHTAAAVNNWRMLLVQSFTARMPLLTATSALGLGRKRWSSHQQCYLHCLRIITIKTLQTHSHILFHHFCHLLPKRGGSVAEWLACWTQAQKGPGSNRSRDAVGQQS